MAIKISQTPNLKIAFCVKPTVQNLKILNLLWCREMQMFDISAKAIIKMFLDEFSADQAIH